MVLTWCLYWVQLLVWQHHSLAHGDVLLRMSDCRSSFWILWTTFGHQKRRGLLLPGVLYVFLIEVNGEFPVVRYVHSRTTEAVCQLGTRFITVPIVTTVGTDAHFCRLPKFLAADNAKGIYGRTKTLYALYWCGCARRKPWKLKWFWKGEVSHPFFQITI
jgi:hypothetical protein